MSRKTIYIARHGQTDFNLKKIVQGSGVDSVLNEKGIAQAEKLFNAYQHVPFGQIITSKLQRTIQTAAGFIEKFNTHNIYPEFNEIDWGILEGVKPSPENRQEFWEVTKAWSQGHLERVVGQGESPLQVQSRMRLGLDKLKREKAENILVVSHGRAMRIMLCTFLNIPLRRMDEFPHSNTSVYKLELENDIFKLQERNNTAHLDY